jgi:hypothetical protein
MKYYYDPDTGIFKYRCDGELIKYNLPYIEKSEMGWIYSDYRVDIETGELIHEPQPKNPRSI